jgi:hypothetical protein
VGALRHRDIGPVSIEIGKIWSLSNALTSTTQELSHPTVQGNGQSGRIPASAAVSKAVLVMFPSSHPISFESCQSSEYLPGG